MIRLLLEQRYFMFWVGILYQIKTQEQQMGKILNDQGQTPGGSTMNYQQNSYHHQQKQSHSSLVKQTRTIYLTHQPPSNLLSQYLQKFNCYKRFVQNTIIQLGEDWRIESGLLAQEIINERNLNNDEFCIFNEFMAGFVRAKVVQLQRQSPVQFQERQQQYEFLRYFCHSFEYNGKQVDIITEQLKLNNNNNTTNSTLNVTPQLITASNKQTDFSSNLTFKTLSLGFYITAGDVWMRMFKKYHKLQVEEGIGKIVFSQQQKHKDLNNRYNVVKYFASLIICRPISNIKSNNNKFNTIQQQWIIQPEEQISALLLPYQQMLMNNNNDSRNSTQHLRKSIKMGSVVVNVTQTTIEGKNEVRQITLCRQFYLQLFLVWLVFSIKKSFNSTLFPSSCFIRYCDIIIGSRIFLQKQKDLVNYHSIYNQFKLLCDNEWKNLMKDYMVALNDDREVLKVLVRRIEGLVIERFNKEIDGKKEEIDKMNYSDKNKFN